MAEPNELRVGVVGVGQRAGLAAYATGSAG
jgi:hypothetical protein